MEPLTSASPRAAWAFVAGALAWTWSLGFGAVALDASAGHPLHLIALLGPAVAWVGVLVTAVPTGTRRSFLRRVVDVREVPRRWWGAVVAIGVGPALIAAAAGAADRNGAAVEPSLSLSSTLGALAFAAAAGLAEEPGWRGHVVSGLLADRPSVAVGVGLGLLWSAWHLPLYFIDDTYQSDLGRGTEFWVALISPIPLSLLLVWLVAGTHGAIVAAVAAHALGNLTGELLATGTSAAVAGLTALIVAAVAVVHRGGWTRRLHALSASGERAARRVSPGSRHDVTHA